MVRTADHGCGPAPGLSELDESAPMSSSPPVSDTPSLPGFADVQTAAARLAGKAVATPLLESPMLNARLGGRLLVKAEPLQRTGSFKFRGAYNALSQLPPAARARGVVAYSSGNHAQGVAAAAQMLGMPAVIVMPSDAPSIKIANTKGYGADVVLYDRWGESREEVAARIAAERGAEIIPPFDDARIIAGQGTVGLEIAAQAAAVGARLDAAIVPVSGGGLIAGCALALTHEVPEIAIHSAEPVAFDDHRRSLADGTRQRNAPGGKSFCDALLAPMPGELTFPINKRLLRGGFAVDDDAVADAMAVAFDIFKLVVEPGGAVALAAVLSAAIEIKGKTVAVVASGGNVDRGTFADALRRASLAASAAPAFRQIVGEL
jgi:threonine dehydratase